SSLGNSTKRRPSARRSQILGKFFSKNATTILKNGGQPESQFGADYLRKNHLSQKFAELRCIEIISGQARLQIP
ncbi:hypothetical protein, partial [Desulfosarcina sp.]|uniref:hypothetical protein n=1 Tax=Desulfosarcina sp. TaxID=2027861 RepID=UPI0029A9D536